MSIRHPSHAYHIHFFLGISLAANQDLVTEKFFSENIGKFCIDFDGR